MINFNGTLLSRNSNSLYNNRSFLYGDAVFETFKIVKNQVLYFEDHYFRLMASMRILRMEIPMNFTYEFLEESILNTAKANNCVNSARVRITVFRNEGGFYAPTANTVSFIIIAEPIECNYYFINSSTYEVDLFKDFYISKQLLSTLKTTNKLIQITGSIYAKENNLQNCLLLNESKNVVEALNGNVFLLKGKQLFTPPISEGCLNGIMRKKIIEFVKKDSNFEIIEEPISPFEIQKSDELFITNVISGIQPVTKYRKKNFETHCAQQLIEKINKSYNLI